MPRIQGMDEKFAIISVVALGAGSSSFVIWTIANSIRRAKVARLAAEAHAKIMDKFGTSEQMLAYLNSEAGQKFLTIGVEAPGAPHGRILNAAQIGAVLLVFGLAMMAVQRRLPEESGAVGALIAALGVGFLLSAGISFWLSSKWGLFRTEQ